MSTATISPKELSRLLSEKPNLPVIDVRTPVEYAEVRVPQAKLTPLDALDPKGLAATGTIPSEEPFYVLCRSGKRATTAAEKFAGAGFTNAVVVEGGTLGWIEAGLPVERDQGVISLERQVRIAAGSLVLTGAILGRFVHPGFYGLSAFVGAGLVFAGVTDFCGMGLLLAKAPWNRKAA
jgi:rhodanese-related sulfurtransferase